MTEGQVFMEFMIKFVWTHSYLTAAFTLHNIIIIYLIVSGYWYHLVIPFNDIFSDTFFNCTTNRCHSKIDFTPYSVLFYSWLSVIKIFMLKSINWCSSSAFSIWLYFNNFVIKYKQCAVLSWSCDLTVHPGKLWFMVCC